MTTQAEYQELLKLQANLKKASSIKKNIEQCNERITEQIQKKDNLPKFKDPGHHSAKLYALENKKDTRHTVITLTFGILFLIYAAIDTWFFWEPSTIFGYIDELIGVLIGMAGMIYCSYKQVVDQGVYPPIGFIVSAVQNVLGGLLFMAIAGGISYWTLFYWKHAIVLAVCGVLSLIITITFDIIVKKSNEENLKAAEMMDKTAYDAYIKEIDSQKERLLKEEAEIIPAIEKEKSAYLNELNAVNNAISQCDILSSQDRNEYTVKTLIDYFDRKRVTSIKEGINLFIQEEHLYQAELQASIERGRQSAALKRMEDNQYLHNRQMEELERERNKLEKERNKKIDDAIRDMKNRY